VVWIGSSSGVGTGSCCSRNCGGGNWGEGEPWGEGGSGGSCSNDDPDPWGTYIRTISKANVNRALDVQKASQNYAHHLQKMSLEEIQLSLECV
jgi:hypothetical protein